MTSLASLDKDAFQQFCRHFEELFNNGDAAGMAACYTDDAKLLAENTELISGRAGIELFWRHAIDRARAAHATRTITLDEVTTSGDLGYALGTVNVRIPGRPEMTTKYATIWQRLTDGRWQLAVDSSSPNPQAALLQHVAEELTPECGEPVGVGGVDDQLTDGHAMPVGVT